MVVAGLVVGALAVYAFRHSDPGVDEKSEVSVTIKKSPEVLVSDPELSRELQRIQTPAPTVSVVPGIVVPPAASLSAVPKIVKPAIQPVVMASVKTPSVQPSLARRIYKI